MLPYTSTNLNECLILCFYKAGKATKFHIHGMSFM